MSIFIYFLSCPWLHSSVMFWLCFMVAHACVELWTFLCINFMFYLTIFIVLYNIHHIDRQHLMNIIIVVSYTDHYHQVLFSTLSPIELNSSLSLTTIGSSSSFHILHILQTVVSTLARGASVSLVPTFVVHLV